jgi:peptidoglycan hydrolase-like protein with peptidoglycan-binding domain
MAGILQSVGKGGVNRNADVQSVQTLLNQYAQALSLAQFPIDGVVNDRLITAIRLFQRRAVQLAAVDGRIDPGGRSWQALSGPATPMLAAIAATANRMSGAAWWHANQNQFPNSSNVADLEPAFAAMVSAFIAALRAAGASVSVSATRRNKIRAYLMHYSWKIAHGTIQAADVPGEPGCSIIWEHGDTATSRAAAQQMVNLFGIVFQPSLTSRHILGLAIDMTTSWSGSITVSNGAGINVTLSTPRTDANTTLHAVGASYGVIKLLSDPPHWSDNGH